MFQLTHPIWLVTAAGIIIPVIIHLWNIKKGKTFKVGSIAFLTHSSPQTARSVRLTELLLLLLRCLFIFLLALILSKPVWKLQPEAGGIKGWIMSEPGTLAVIYPAFKPVIDSLLLAGFEYHFFSPGFKKADFLSLLKNRTDTLSEGHHTYWSLLKTLDQELPADLPVHLFTGNRLNRFSGNRPDLSLNLQWHTYTSEDSGTRTLAQAYLTPADSIQVITSESGPFNTLFTKQTISAAAHRYTDYAVQIEAGRLWIHRNKGVGKNDPDSIEVDTATLSILVYTDVNTADARYVQAAIQAIRQYTTRKIKLSIARDVKDIPAGLNWLFWLSDQPVIRSLQADNIFRYKKGKPQLIYSSVGIPGLHLNAGTLALFKRIPPDTTVTGIATSIWKDGFGDPVLLKESVDSNTVYNFFSRFDPEWNDLAWSDEFPVMLLNLILGNGDNQAGYLLPDKRAIDTQQLKPGIALQKKTIGTGPVFKNTDLSYFFWLTAFLIFLLERIWSLNKKQVSNG